ncbi:hypothetical protein [Streptomyces sp. CA-251247]|uniref:hypothetical protein n=1 Tax=Streptomyces sp. CA-251247 TaxID=3240062 RepID=UPI003D931A30
MVVVALNGGTDEEAATEAADGEGYDGECGSCADRTACSESPHREDNWWVQHTTQPRPWTRDGQSSADARS